jgi:hypothetical protein
VSTSPSADPFATLTVLLQRYVRGEVEVAELVAAYQALPDGTSGDFACALDDVDPEEADARLAALAVALGPPPRAG